MEDFQDCNSNSLVAVPGFLVLHLFRLLGQQDNSWQKYTLAYFLLVRNEYFPREPRKQHSDVNEQLVLCCDSSDFDSKEVEVEKQDALVKTQSGGDSSSNGSNDCFLPGLHDDLAQDCLAWTSRSDYPSLSCLNKKFNLLINGGYLYKLRRKYGIVENWVYLACSLMPWEAFDPSRNRWMRLPRLPCDDCFSCADKESLAVGTQLLVFGREYTGLAIGMYSSSVSREQYLMGCGSPHTSRAGPAADSCPAALCSLQRLPSHRPVFALAMVQCFLCSARPLQTQPPRRLSVFFL